MDFGKTWSNWGVVPLKNSKSKSLKFKINFKIKLEYLYYMTIKLFIK